MSDGSVGRVNGGIGAQTLLVHVFVQHLHGRGIVTLTQPHLPQNTRHWVTLVSVMTDVCQMYSPNNQPLNTLYTHYTYPPQYMHTTGLQTDYKHTTVHTHYIHTTVHTHTTVLHTHYIHTTAHTHIL